MSPASDEREHADHWIEVVRAKVAAIRFGSVQITVHDGRVTQVEAIEKTRISADQSEPVARGARTPRKQ